MMSLRRLTLFSVLLLTILCMATPTQTTAAFLWGHPYAIQIDDMDNGWVHMWNDLNLPTPYVGTGLIVPIGTSTAHQNTWDLLVMGMVNKKLTYFWTDSGPGTNDGSTGNITNAIVTIFGN